MPTLIYSLMMQNNNTILILFSPLFDKRLRQLPGNIIAAFNATIDLFLDSQHHVLLRRRFLKEKYAGLKSIDITDEYRAVLKEIKKESLHIIKFHIIGTHDQLYGK